MAHPSFISSSEIVKGVIRMAQPSKRSQNNIRPRSWHFNITSLVI
jgi:hypothetical protein